MTPDIIPPADEIPEPTFTTLSGVASVNGVYADHTCCEEDGQYHKKHKGESLDGVEGWEPDDEPTEDVA